MGIIGVLGFAVIATLAVQGYDRAIMLVPTWVLLLAWLAGAAMTVTGVLANDIVQPALAGGLVLVVLLIGFTVMQHAFAGGAIAQGLISDVERRRLPSPGRATSSGTGISTATAFPPATRSRICWASSPAFSRDLPATGSTSSIRRTGTPSAARSTR